MAIDFSDGVVEAGGDVNTDLLAYAKERQKWVLDNPGGDYAPAYKDFYNKILAGE